MTTNREDIAFQDLQAFSTTASDSICELIRLRGREGEFQIFEQDLLKIISPDQEHFSVPGFQRREWLLSRIAELKRQNDDLQSANVRLEQRARDAESLDIVHPGTSAASTPLPEPALGDTVCVNNGVCEGAMGSILGTTRYGRFVVERDHDIVILNRREFDIVSKA